MKTEQVLAEIHEANASYLQLAQSLLRADREAAIAQLGITDASATMLSRMSPAQLQRIAHTNTLLCRFGMNEDAVFQLLASHGRRASDQRREPASPAETAASASASFVDRRA